jgi:hypothetical protein
MPLARILRPLELADARLRCRHRCCQARGAGVRLVWVRPCPMDGGRLPGVLALRRVGVVRAGGRRKASARGWAALPVGLRLDTFIKWLTCADGQ